MAASASAFVLKIIGNKLSPIFWGLLLCFKQCCGAGTGTFFSEPELLRRSGSGSTIDKTEEILNDILFVSSHIDKKLFKKQILISKLNFSS